VGRTGRADATGDAFTFVSEQEESDLRAIEKATGKRLPRVTLPDFDYKTPIAEPPAPAGAPAPARGRGPSAAQGRGASGRPGQARAGGKRGQGQGGRSVQGESSWQSHRRGRPAPQHRPARGASDRRRDRSR